MRIGWLRGKGAEDEAAAFLKGLGYRILERNFRLPFGEIDIVAQDGEAVVFVEVKSRASAKFGLAQEMVGPSKRRKLVKAALAYAQRRRLDCPMRFDVVAFNAGAALHIRGAFTSDRV